MNLLVPVQQRFPGELLMTHDAGEGFGFAVRLQVLAQIVLGEELSVALVTGEAALPVVNQLVQV